MPTASARRQAAIIIGLLSIALLVSILPFVTGLLGAPVLYVLFAPLYRRLVRRMRPSIASGICVALALLLLVLPAVAAVLLLAGDLPRVVQSISSGQLTARLETVQIGSMPIGTELSGALTEGLRWLSSRSVAMLSSLTMTVIEAIIALFGLYFLLVYSREWWATVRAWIPFSDYTTELLREQFHEVTIATVGGVLLTALLQATVVGFSFWLVGLERPAFWGAVTGFLSVLPILGSALVWVPGSIVLLMRHEPGAALTLGLIGFVIASNVDNIAMLILLKRVSGIHPLVAIIGVFAGAHMIGLAGVLLGPLVLAYFLELLEVFTEEYRPPSVAVPLTDPPSPDSGLAVMVAPSE